MKKATEAVKAEDKGRVVKVVARVAVVTVGIVVAGGNHGASLLTSAQGLQPGPTSRVGGLAPPVGYRG